MRGFFSLVAIYMLFIAFTTIGGDFEKENRATSDRVRELCIRKIRTFSLNRAEANSVCEDIKDLQERR